MRFKKQKTAEQIVYLKPRHKDRVSQAGEKIVLNWGKQAQESKVLQLMKTVVTIITYRTGILASHNSPVSTEKVRVTRKI